MAEKKNESFTVTDRRLFTADGELRTEATEATEEETSAPAAATAAPTQPEPPSSTGALG